VRRGVAPPDDRRPAVYAGAVDLGAVKAAATPDLVKCAVGAAANAGDLLDDAEVLSAAGRHARAYALAALAVEEAGKAVSLAGLAVMPLRLRAQAPVGRMLEWHQLKLVGGMLIAAVPPGTRTMAGQLAAMPPSQVARMLENAQALADDQDRLKQRGLYADIDRIGRVRLPSEVGEADVAAQLRQARRAVSSAGTLLDPRAPAFLANPPPEVIELCRALVSAFAEAGCGRTAQAAADVYLDAVRKLRERTAASDARARSDRVGRAT
jgi:AbiV family abortive infection protein